MEPSKVALKNVNIVPRELYASCGLIPNNIFYSCNYGERAHIKLHEYFHGFSQKKLGPGHFHPIN